MHFIAKKFDLLFIGTGGILTGISIAAINESLQTIVLLLTIAGLIWRMFKKRKY